MKKFITLIFFIIFSGCSYEEVIDYNLYTTSTKYVTADYSEMSVSVDFDGMPEMDTDYWSEDASIRCVVKTRNKKVMENNCPVIEVDGVQTSNHPSINEDHSRERHFDNYAKHASILYSVRTSENGMIGMTKRNYLQALRNKEHNLPIYISKFWHIFKFEKEI